MSDIVKELQEISEFVKNNENKKARLEGEIESIMKQLESKFSLTSIRDAKRKLEEMQNEQAKLKEQIEAGMIELRKQLPEDWRRM